MDKSDLARNLREYAPYGFIEHNNKIIVGSPHGKATELSSDLQDKVKQYATDNGLYYEGVGGDINNNKNLLGDKSSYAGSWDDNFAKNIKDYPSDFLYTIFTNVDTNNQAKHLINEKNSIGSAILNAQQKVGYFKDRKFDDATLQKFLTDASDDDVDFAAMSQLPATKENVKRFLSVGEQKMWPENWQKYPHNAGKIAQKAEELRNDFIMNSKEPGVYVVGSGHINELKNRYPDLNVIGGEKSQE
jgi:hypothetical protein